MLTINDLVDKYGDMPLTDEVLHLFGIVEPKKLDCMLRIDDVEKILNSKNGSAIIRRLKAKNNLNYNEAMIPASVFSMHYGMNTQEVINFVKEKVDSAKSTKD